VVTWPAVVAEGDGLIRSLACLVKTLRSASGLSQEELAERAGLSVQAISAIERGTQRLARPITVRAIASALSLSAEDRSQLWHAAAGEADLIAQLPLDIADPTGRESEVAATVAALTPDQLTQAATVLYVWGKPGVGKSALALHVAHLLRSRFPPGQLYINLQGATVSVAPLKPLDALSRILRSFGLGPIPSSTTSPSTTHEELNAPAGSTHRRPVPRRGVGARRWLGGFARSGRATAGARSPLLIPWTGWRVREQRRELVDRPTACSLVLLVGPLPVEIACPHSVRVLTGDAGSHPDAAPACLHSDSLAEVLRIVDPQGRGALRLEPAHEGRHLLRQRRRDRHQHAHRLILI